MNKNHTPLSYKIGKTLAYLILILATILITTGSTALLKLLICFILGYTQPLPNTEGLSS